MQGIVIGNERRRGRLDNSVESSVICGLGSFGPERHFKIMPSTNNFDTIRGVSTVGCQSRLRISYR